MNRNKKRAPEVRFKGFVEDWEQRKLEDIADINPKSILPTEFEYVDLESVIGTELTSHQTKRKESAPSRAQRLAQRGDIFYQMVRPYQKNNYLFDLPYDNYVFSTGYAQIRPNIVSYFLFSRLQEEKFVSKVLNRCTGTSYPAINSNDLSEIEVGISPIKEEQSRIGEFLKHLDNTIALHQRRVSRLRQLKKGFLQMMFPQKGKIVPKLRFANFDSKWEQRNLGEIVERVKSYALSRNFETSNYTGYKYIHYGDIHTKVADIIDESSDLPNIKIGNYEFVKKGDLVLADASEDYQGIATPAVVTIDTTYKLVSGLHTIALRPKNDDSMFLYYLFNSPTFKKYGYKTGTGIKVFGISTTNLLKFYSQFPTKEEQEKIGSILKQLDKTIALHQTKFGKVQALKKAFLQKMFI
ncbi:restriction endonuclease subunit S [Lentibacillus sp. Marseille-P4043]|uniref:restriction endonuclease subunit S n=1 Tax=Lentibacillus sp. Marseille-P4043 TaxID=2040293 RepID=UPI001F473D48|nr:restriction endonuclease subunit S [Lentibacillus sp. Marseille-P4043]